MQLHPFTTADATMERMAEAGSAESVQGPRWRKRLAWGGVGLAAVLLLTFIPPLINANRYQRQIARSMSQSLGRPVHLDNASLHLLPVPGLTLSNLVVSEDPAFGDEPTIRANAVEATLRLGSLWRRRVEFSSVRFIEPSVNLVRNAQGRWNLADVLLHASHLETAPTVQRRAGPAPRFPYIEATGGRVNLKLGVNKLPFSLTDADFALWLPEADHWRVRLKGQPARTDTSINDPGVLRVEGDLSRAETAPGIPVNLNVSWHDAPLGEASRLVTSDDMGWRGMLNLDATLAGTLSLAQLQAKFTLSGLRRAEFAPAYPLDLQITCGSTLAAASTTLHALRCFMPDSAPEPMLLTASALDLARPADAVARLSAPGIPLRWGLLWAAMFSARVPTDLNPAGSLDLNLQYSDANAAPKAPSSRSRPYRRARVVTSSGPGASAPSTKLWTGTVEVHLPPAPAVARRSPEERPAADERAKPSGTNLVWHIVPNAAPQRERASSGAGTAAGYSFVLSPVDVPLGPDAFVNLAAKVTSTGYTLTAAGTANAAALLQPARYLPQLGDGLENILPFPPTGLDLARVDFTCTHPWGALQSCTPLRPTASTGRGGAAVPASILPQGVPAVQLAPRSLSPLDRQPGLGGMPPLRAPNGAPQTSPRL